MATHHLQNKLNIQEGNWKEIQGNVDNLEQKTKRHSIRIVGLKEEEDEDVKAKFITFARNNLNVQNIKHEDIEDIATKNRVPRKHAQKGTTYGSDSDKTHSDCIHSGDEYNPNDHMIQLTKHPQYSWFTNYISLSNTWLV